ncbi:uncharacterized protein PG998_009300 [Apiospora kogelbergensis]|uniref:Uncharacterized protein n=1 Tax=Apiospora kogelbergensis TaxID=1337665 RepID=A0AAW0R7J4_9PEZI
MNAAEGRTSGDLPHRAQRLWAMRRRARILAGPLFEQTAASMLSQDVKDSLWEAVLLCLRDATKMVERAIATVLSDNVDLFQVNHDGEKADDSLPSELM